MTDLFMTEEIPTFEEFWAAWPKGFKKKPKYARQCWGKLHDHEKRSVLEDLEHREERDKKWIKSSRGRFIPNPSTYLNQGCWDDDYEDCRTDSGKSLDERRKVNW